MARRTWLILGGAAAGLAGWRTGWIARQLVRLSGTELGQVRGSGTPLSRPLRLDPGTVEPGSGS